MIPWAAANSVVLAVSILVPSALASSISRVSARNRTAFTPEKKAFSIWALIYALLIGAAVSQFYDPSLASDLGPWFVVQACLTLLWCAFFVRERLRLAALSLVAAAAAAAVCYARAQRWSTICAQNGGRVLASVAFSIYLGWLLIAATIGIYVALRREVAPERAFVWAALVSAVVATQAVNTDPLLSLPVAWAAVFVAVGGDGVAAAAAVVAAVSFIVVQVISVRACG